MGRGKSFCLEPGGDGGLTLGYMDGLPPYLDSLREYPQWLVVGCLTLVAAVGLWLLAKLLKWTIYLLVAAVLVIGGLAAVWLWLN